MPDSNSEPKSIACGSSCMVMSFSWQIGNFHAHFTVLMEEKSDPLWNLVTSSLDRIPRTCAETVWVLHETSRHWTCYVLVVLSLLRLFLSVLEVWLYSSIKVNQFSLVVTQNGAGIQESIASSMKTNDSELIARGGAESSELVKWVEFIVHDDGESWPTKGFSKNRRQKER